MIKLDAAGQICHYHAHSGLLTSIVQHSFVSGSIILATPSVVIIYWQQAVRSQIQKMNYEVERKRPIPVLWMARFAYDIAACISWPENSVSVLLNVIPRVRAVRTYVQYC